MSKHNGQCDHTGCTAAALSSVTGPALPQVLREALDAGLAGSVAAGRYGGCVDLTTAVKSPLLL